MKLGDAFSIHGSYHEEPRPKKKKRMSAQEVIDAARVRCMELDQEFLDNIRKESFDRIRKDLSIDVEFRVVKEPKELTNGSQKLS